MNISIGGYSFYNTFLEGKMDVFGYLETVKYRYRMDAVDLWNGFFIDRSDSVYKLADKSYIRKIREALDEKEMRVVNFAVDGAHLWDPDPDLRQRLYENALVHLDAAEILGAETVRIDTGGSYKGSEPMTYEQFEYTVKRYREYADRAADGGYTIGPEYHMGASLLPREMKRLAVMPVELSWNDEIVRDGGPVVHLHGIGSTFESHLYCIALYLFRIVFVLYLFCIVFLLLTD
ncbi:sugar phosphate isomerase/epimerase family protein [Paenibacillus sp. NPDC093718]|uniref:sugar phosphate isomerase/epimerase family protein n=1 Tax=Paenibacillus sp. NPDC093718 TaxID=3390601 RepID=UPI003D062887